ncbi:glyceraldehyde-3-phosphate dehydrogenase 1 [Kappamyces sp. JEL0680]|nr:glyceraldehyde-3-phosphate dehydrogenase 1 [Kappamyces sp. JEL0680]
MRFQKFLNDMCEIGDFYEALEVRVVSHGQMEQYIALSKKEIELNITLNEMYSTHQFLYQHLDTLAPEKDSHLRICLQDLGPAPAQLSRLENKTIPLALFSRWDQTNIDISSAGAADQLTRGEFLYYDAKALFVQILRLSPNIANMKPLDLDNVVEAASTSRDPQLVRKGLKLGDMLQELVRLKQISPADGYALMKEEISQELLHLGNLAEKIQKEMNSLGVVYKTIQDHNDYLRSQLETYKAYLQNVRVQAVPGQTQKSQKTLAPQKFTHQKLEHEGVICESNVPENR